MQEMIDTIRGAVTEGATAEQKAAGALACRTILAALEAEPGKAIAVAGAPTPGPLAGISADQALDLLIARLSAIAEKQPSAATAPPAKSAPLRIAFVQPPPRAVATATARRKP
jgi:hypothetical protein